jgi:hypothetical protein
MPVNGMLYGQYDRALRNAPERILDYDGASCQTAMQQKSDKWERDMGIKIASVEPGPRIRQSQFTVRVVETVCVVAFASVPTPVIVIV